MSLLLLFHSTGIVPHADGTAAAVAGAFSRSSGGRGARSSGALAVAGASGYAVGFRGASGGTAAAVAGGYGRSAGNRATAGGLAAAVAGAYARGSGGRGIGGSSAAVAGSLARIRAKALRVGTPLIMLTRLVLSLDPSEVSFTKAGESGPYPLLLAIGTLRLAARAGHISGIGTTESTSVTISLDNRGGRAAAIIGRPLRIRARIYDGPDLFFDGTVASIAYGQTIQLQIEA